MHETPAPLRVTGRLNQQHVKGGPSTSRSYGETRAALPSPNVLSLLPSMQAAHDACRASAYRMLRPTASIRNELVYPAEACVACSRVTLLGAAPPPPPTSKLSGRCVTHGSSRTFHPPARGVLHDEGNAPSSSRTRTTVPDTHSSIPTSLATDSDSPNNVNPTSKAPAYSKAVYIDHAEERVSPLSAMIVHAALRLETANDPTELAMFVNPCDCLNRYEHVTSVMIEPTSASQCHQNGPVAWVIAFAVAEEAWMDVPTALADTIMLFRSRLHR